MLRSVLLILVIIAAPAAALVKRSIAGGANPPILRLRGGLGSIDPTMVAKVATGLLSANSAFVGLAPEKAAEVTTPPRLFRIARCSATVNLGEGQPLTAHAACPFQVSGIKLGGRSAWILEYDGYTLAMGAILAVVSLSGSSLNNAVAWSCLPYTVFVLQGILQGRPAKHRVNAAGQYLELAINTFM